MPDTKIITRNNALFGHQNYVLTGILSADAFVTGFDPGRLQSPHGAASEAWQTPSGTTTARLILDSGDIREWRAFGLFRTNLTEDAEVRWRLSNDSAGTSVILDTSWIPANVKPGYGQHIYTLALLPRVEPDPPPLLLDENGLVLLDEEDGEGGYEVEEADPSSYVVTEDDYYLVEEDGSFRLITEGTGVYEGGPTMARFCILDVRDPTNPDGFLNIPQAFMGNAWEPDRNISGQSGWGVDAQVAEARSRSGQEYPTLMYEQRRWTIALEAVSDDLIWNGAAEVFRVGRRGQNILFVPFPQSDDVNYEAIFGRLRATSDVNYPYNVKTYRSIRATVIERL